MTKSIAVQGIKGGVGTTTISVALYSLLDANLSATDSKDLDILADGLHIHDTEKEFSIKDVGVIDTHSPLKAFDHNILVLRTDYLSLNRAFKTARLFDTVIIVKVPNTSISPEQFIDTLQLNKSVIVLELDPNVARANDAGLIACRLPESLSEPLTQFTNDLKVA